MKDSARKASNIPWRGCRAMTAHLYRLVFSFCQITGMTDRVFTLFGHRIPPVILLIIAFGLCLRLVYFPNEIGGSHTFRQAMVANQIDSLKSGPYPGPKLGFLERYDQVY